MMIGVIFYCYKGNDLLFDVFLDKKFYLQLKL
jgi:hypothetical protein